MNCLFISYSYIFLWNLAIVHCFIYYLFILYLRLSPTGCPHLSLLFLISNNALNISSSRSDRGPTYCRVQIVLEVINGRQDSLRPTLGIVDVDVWIKNRISSVIETYIRIINVSGTLIAAATGSTVIGTMERRQLWEEISKDLYQALEISTCEISKKKKISTCELDVALASRRTWKVRRMRCTNSDGHYFLPASVSKAQSR